MCAEKIKSYLLDNGISQTFLSNKTKIATTTLNAILNGKRKLLASEYFLICNALELPLDYFRA